MKDKSSFSLTHSRRARSSGGGMLRGSITHRMCLGLGLGLFLGLLFSNGSRGLAGGVQITGSLANFEVRYPNSLPNDLEIVLYGVGLKTNDVTGCWDSNNPSYGSQGIGWGTPSSLTPGISTDTNSPSYGLSGVTVRYSGPPRPALVGQMVHFGVRLRIGAMVAHQEVWWTLNGQRILRPGETHVAWVRLTNAWVICIANPNPMPTYVYGPRYFEIAPGVALPLLSQMGLGMQPQQFGAADWTNLSLPEGIRVYGIPAFSRTYIRVLETRQHPIIFQIAARTVPESVLPLPSGTVGPNEADFDGVQGTMFIGTTRATQEFPEDINGDGAVGIPDFNQLRSAFGIQSEDLGTQ